MENLDNNPMQSASKMKCGAKTRSGQPCANFRMKNGRCRMHGGKSTGAPKGNQNAFKHGLNGKEARSHRALVRQLLRDLNDFNRREHDAP